MCSNAGRYTCRVVKWEKYAFVNPEISLNLLRHIQHDRLHVIIKNSQFVMKVLMWSVKKLERRKNGKLKKLKPIRIWY
jgi:hypothetical protein